MTEIRIVEYCGGNTFTEGWEKIYSIQPMQAFGSYDFAEDEVDDFVEVIEIDLSENEALDLDGDIVREFGGRLRAMIEGENDIGVLTIERKQRKIEEKLKRTLSEYLVKYELEPYDAKRFNMEAIFKKEIFSTEHKCSISLFEDPETAEKIFLISTTSESSLYGESDFYDDFLPNTQEASILASKWFFSQKFRTTENANALCRAVNAAQKNGEKELDIEEKMQNIIFIGGEDGNFLDATEEWQRWREGFAGDYICCTNEGDLIINTPNGLIVEEWSPRRGMGER